MATEIDKRVVEMQFDNKDFEKNCKETLSTLDKLKMALNFDGAKGLKTVGEAAKKVDLSNISKGAEAVSVKFSAMQVAGMTAISELTRSFMNFGKTIWNKTFGQISKGGFARTLKIDQANFQMKALAKNMKDIGDNTERLAYFMDKMGKSIDEAVSGTAYGYDSAASVAAQLMASGLTDAEKMYNHLRAIAGAASMTGKSFDDIGNVFTTVASNGRLMTMQLRQFSSYGLNLSATIAQQMGKTEQQINDMVHDGKITFEQFSEALYKAYGDAAGKADETWSGVTANVKAQLSRIGQVFTDPLVEKLIPVLASLKAALRDLNNKVIKPMQPLFRQILKKITDSMKDTLDNLNIARLKTIANAIQNIFTSIVLVVDAVRQAFREVFPKKTSEELYDAARSFEQITQALFPTKETLEGIKNVVKLILVPTRIVYNLLRALSESALKPIAISLFRLLNSIFGVVNALEPFITALIDTVVNSKLFNTFLTAIAGAIIIVINALTELANITTRVFNKLFNNSSTKQFLDALKSISEFLNKAILYGLWAIFYIIQKIFSYITVDNIMAVFQGIINIVNFFIYLVQMAISSIAQLAKGATESGSIIGNIINFIKNAVELLIGVFKGDDVSQNLQNIKDALSGVGSGIKKLVKDIIDAVKEIDVGKLMLIAFGMAVVFLVFQLGFLVSASTKLVRSVNGLTGILTKFKNAFLGIGRVSPVAQLFFALTLAIGTLTAALVTLSNDVDPEKLKTAAIALGALVGTLMGFSVAMTILTTRAPVSFDVGVKSFLVLMMSIAGSIWMLSTALKAMTDITFNWDQFKGPLLAIIALIVSMGAVVAGISALSGPVEGQLSMGAVAILAFAVAIKILAGVLIALSDAGLFKRAGDAIAALISVIFLLGTLAGAIATVSLAGGGLGSGLAMIGIALSLLILIKVLKKIADVPADKIEAGFKRLLMMCVPILGFIVAMGIISKVAGVGFLAGLGGTFSGLTFLLIVLSTLVMILGSMNLANVMVGLVVVNALSNLLTNLIKKIILVMGGMNPNAIGVAQVYMKNLKGFLIGLGATMVLLAISTRIVNGVDLVSVLEVGFLLTILGNLALRFATLSKETEHAKIGPIIAMIVALSAMMGALAILSFQDPVHIAVAAGAMSLVISAVIGMMALINKLQDTGGKIIATTSKAPFKKSKIFKTIAITVGIIAGITLFLTVIATALGGLAKTANEVVTNNMATQIALLGTEVGTKPDAATQNLAAFGPLGILLGATVGLVVIAGLLYKWFDKIAKTSTGNLMQKAAMLISIASIIVLCVSAISVLGMVQTKMNNPTDILFAGIALSLAVTALAAVIAAMSKIPSNQAFNSIKVAAAIAIAAGAMVILALAITPLALLVSKGIVNWYDVIASSGVLALAILAIGLAMNTIMSANNANKNAYLKAATAMVIATSSLLVIALAVGGLAYALTSNLVGGWEVAGVVLLLSVLSAIIFSSLEKLTEKSGGVSKGKVMRAALAMVIAASAVLLIGASVALIGKGVENIQSIGMIATALGFFTGIIVILSVLLGVLAAISSKIDTGKLILATAAFAILAGSISVIALVIAGLAKVSKDMNSVNFDSIMRHLSEILGIFAIMMIVGGVIAAIPIIGKGVLLGMIMISAAFAIFAAGVALLAKAAKSFAEVVDTVVDDFIKLNSVHIDSLELSHNIRAIKKIAPQVADAFVAIVHEVIRGIGGITYEIVDLGTTFTLAFLQGINQKLPEILDTFLGIMKTIGEFLSNEENMGAIETFCEKIGEVLFTVISGIISGLFKEINNEIDKLQDKYFKQERDQTRQKYDNITSKNIADNFLKYGATSLKDIFEKQGYSDTFLNDTLLNPEGFITIMKSDLLDYEKFSNEMKTDIAVATELRRKQGYTDDYVFNQLIENMKVIADLNGLAYDSDEIKEYGAKIAKLTGIYDLYSSKTGYIDRVMKKAMESTEELADGLEESADKVEEANEKAQDAIEGTADAVEDAKDKIEKGDMFGALIEKGKEMFGGEEGFLGALKDKAKSGLESLTGLFGDIGSAFGEEFGISFDSGALGNLDLTGFMDVLMTDGIDNASLAGLLGGKAYSNAFFQTQEEEMAVYLKEANKSVFVGNRSASGAPLAGGSYKKYYETLTDEQGKQLYKNADEYAQAQYKVKHAHDATAESANALGWAYDDVTEAMEEFDTASQNLTSDLEDQKDKFKEFTDSLRSSVEDALKNIFDDPGEMEVLDPSQILDNMWENIRRVGQWSRQISELAKKGISEPLLNELKDMGPQGAATVDAFARMTAEQLQEANRLYQGKMTMPDMVVNDITKSFKEAGFNASLGFSEGIDQTAANEAMKSLGTNSLDALKTELDEHSPSQKTRQMGNWATEGLAMGLVDWRSLSQVYTNAAKVSEKVIKGMEVFLKNSKAVEIGMNFCNGLASGFVSGGQNVVNKASALANAIYQTFIRKFLIHSPSRVMAEVGEYIMMGLGNGIDDGTTYVERQTGESVDEIMDSMKENLYGILDNVGEDGVYHPVIRPVFDLTALDQGWNDINSWFANSQGIDLNSNISRLTPTTYEDNNNSDQAIVDAINNIDTDGIKNEILAMRTDISTLQTAITSMQVVMNTGALVGQIMDPIDAALGQKAMLSNRGRY